MIFRLSKFTVLALLLQMLASCAPTNRLLKSRPVALSPFFEQPQYAVDARKYLPFQKTWTTPNSAVLKAGVAARRLYIAPVTLAYLRPLKRTIARREAEWGLQRQEHAVAARLREEFIAAFRASPAPVYRIVDRPGPGVATLHLAITELNPTCPKGNAAVTLLKVALTPVAGLAGHFTKGNMAIEGKVRGQGPHAGTFFQFADNEGDPLTIVNMRDYQPYGHAVNSMRRWAMQFEQMTRSPAGMRLKDSNALLLRLN